MGETLDGSTTWCDSDSCATVSKCYCSPNEKKPQKKASNKEDAKKGKTGRSRGKDNLALDYELFTVGGNSSKHVRPTEALSVKKSVEMAAVFADVKLSQSTDITNLKSSGKDKKPHKPKHHHKKQHDDIVSAKNVMNKTHVEDFYKSSEVILRKDVEVTSKRITTKTEGYYQSVAPRPVSASLEDSLGYLP